MGAEEGKDGGWTYCRRSKGERGGGAEGGGRVRGGEEEGKFCDKMLVKVTEKRKG